MGEINTTVGLSELFPMRGVKVGVNDHYDLYTQEELTYGKNINASKALEILENWEEKLSYANKIIDGIISYEKK